MEPIELKRVLERLIATWENEVVEFKQAINDYDTEKIGKYFSALSNESNLREMECGWLVFGVDDRTRTVVGTNYRFDPERLQGIKIQVAQNTSPKVTFRDVHVLNEGKERVILFEIPAAPRGIPVSWKGHYYARAGESLVSLGLDKLDEIRQQALATDWTAQIIPNATLADLDETAVLKAREFFAQKYANRFTLKNVTDWPLNSFLDRAGLTQAGNITRACLLLLGKAESSGLLSPHPAQLTWKLEGSERAYSHFGLPFLLNTTWLYKRIRNIQLRILPQGELLPVEVPKYDQKIFLEALHNCIAHQDYDRNGRVVVIEQQDQLIFVNEGGFFDGQPDEYIEGTKVPRRYRNTCLAQAMVKLNMIDSMGYGIHDMYAGQAKRYFPLPDYDLTEPDVVKLTLYGGVVDIAYTRLLIQNTNLPLTDILALDRVQKKLPIPDEAATRLRKSGLIEGRKPKYFVSAVIASATANKVDYIRTRAQNDEFYAKLVIDFLKKFGQASRTEINKLLLDKLSEALDEGQKERKIANLLSKLRRAKRIINIGSRRRPLWKLAE